MIEFGARVFLHSVVKPVYLQVCAERESFHDLDFHPRGDGKIQWREPAMEECEPHLIRVDKDGSDPTDIGFDLPDPTEVPSTRVHRRLRRWPCRRRGVVIGRTWRSEGEYYAPEAGYMSMDGDWDSSPGGLLECRRVWVYQVALEPEFRTVWPVEVVLAIAQDVEVQ